jgi:hypothetical protein
MKSYVMRFGSGDPRTYTGLAPTFLIFCTDTGTTLASPGISEVLSGSGLYYFNWGTTTPISFLADAATTSPGTSGRYVAGSIDPADRADEYGTTLVAIGTTLNAIGTSHIAQGNTMIALGTTTIAIGTTNFALGTSNVALGISNIALGTSNFALGTSIYALEQTLGSTLVAIGNTAIALGTSNIALGTTAVAIGTSLFASNASLTVNIAGIGSAGSTFGGAASDPVDLFGYMKRIQENLEGNSSFTKGSGAWQIYSRGSSVLLTTKTVANGVSIITKT